MEIIQAAKVRPTALPEATLRGIMPEPAVTVAAAGAAMAAAGVADTPAAVAEDGATQVIPAAGAALLTVEVINSIQLEISRMEP